jgi:hypothetical protein
MSPMGLLGCCASFQRLMESVLRSTNDVIMCRLSAVDLHLNISSFSKMQFYYELRTPDLN